MTKDEIVEANRKSALEQLEQDERNEDLKASMRAVELLSFRPSGHTRFSSENYPGEEVSEVHRMNALTVEVETHRYDEQNN